MVDVIMEVKKMENNLNLLKSNCVCCKKCDLCNTRNNVVFGIGNIYAEVLFIGEAPGASEDEQGFPFVGRSGKLLDEMLNVINLSRKSNIYISNIVKCRPPENRNPKTHEQVMCIDWLLSQIDIIKPKIIVCLGAVPSKKMIDKNIKVTKSHGQFFEKGNILYTPFYHPSALLRNPHNKPIAEKDFKLLEKKIKEVCTRTYN